MPQFSNSLGVGKEREEEVMAFMREHGHLPIPIPGKFKGYDFFTANTKRAYEVKQDWKSRYSGNLVVEIAFGGKPSGLSTTQADWWIFHTGEEYIFMQPKTIRKLIKKEALRPAKFVGKGDVKQKEAYLDPVETIKPYAEKEHKR